MRSTLKTIKKCDEKWRKSFLNLSSTHYLSETSKTRNSSFRYPNRPVYSVDRVLTEIDVLFSSIEQKSLCAEIWWNPHEIPVRPRKKLKLAVAHTPKFFDWVFFLSWMSFVLSSLFACVGEKLVEKKRKNGGKEREEKNYWEMSNGVVVIRCLLFSDETYKYHPDFVGFWKYHEDIFHFYHRKA